MVRIAGPFIVFITAIMGFLLAVIEQMAYDNGYVINSYIVGVGMLYGLEILTIVMALLIGCVIAVCHTMSWECEKWKDTDTMSSRRWSQDQL